MARADFLDIRFGTSRWLQVAQLFLAALGLLALLIAPANWTWKLGAIVLLIMVSFFVHAWSVHQDRSGVIHLVPDGAALIHTASGQEVHAVLAPHNWVSRWICVLSLNEVENLAKRHCVICASENHPDEYRRLLKLLRMRTPPAAAQRMIW